VPAACRSATHALSLHDALPIFMWEHGEAVREMLPDLPVIAAEVGVNAFGWVVELPDDYTDPWHPNPLIGRVTREIDDRKARIRRSEEHTSALQSRENLVCRLLL